MIVWLFMILDIIVLISVGIAHFGLGFPTTLLFMSSGYLIIKGLIFLKEFMSKVDLILGVYILIMTIFKFTSFIDFFIYGWFLYKLIFLFMATKGN